MIERGNPSEEDDDFNPETESKAPAQQLRNTSRAQAGLSRNVVIVGILILTSSASFGLGMLAGGQGKASTGNGLIVGSVPSAQPSSALSGADLGSVTTSTSTDAIPAGGEVVASKMTRSYYLPWCSQASKITNDDKVWFATEQMAKSAGYAAGKGCAGI